MISLMKKHLLQPAACGPGYDNRQLSCLRASFPGLPLAQEREVLGENDMVSGLMAGQLDSHELGRPSGAVMTIPVHLVLSV